MPSLLKWVTTCLACNNIQKYGEQTVLQSYLNDEDKEFRGDHFLIFRWNIALHDSYREDEIMIEIEGWKQKVPGVCVKSSIKEFY